MSIKKTAGGALFGCSQPDAVILRLRKDFAAGRSDIAAPEGYVRLQLHPRLKIMALIRTAARVPLKGIAFS